MKQIIINTTNGKDWKHQLYPTVYKENGELINKKKNPLDESIKKLSS